MTMRRFLKDIFFTLRPVRAAVEDKDYTSGHGVDQELTGVLIVSDMDIIHLHGGDQEQCHHLCLEDSQCQRWIWSQDKESCFLDAREDLRGVMMKSSEEESLKAGDRDTILVMEDKLVPVKNNKNKSPPKPKEKKTPKRPTRRTTKKPKSPRPTKKSTSSPAPTADKTTTEIPKTPEEIVAAKKKVVQNPKRRPTPRPKPKRKSLLESDDEESVFVINMDSNQDKSENTEA